MRYTSQSGNALFLILIAVALFAALSYAVTVSGRGGGTVSKETAQLEAAAISSYLGEIRNAVTRLRLTGGCTDAQINFEGSGYTDGPTGPYGGTVMIANNSNPSSPTNDSCDVFHKNGGGVVPRVIQVTNPTAPG
jgi:hypothetical protein